MELFVRNGAIDLWVADEGSGLPIVLSSGGPGCCDYLGPVADLLNGAFRTIRYDARGCGRSSATSDFTLANSIADLEAIRAHFGFDRWTLLGHSAGCELSLAYTIAHPKRVTALVCVSGGRIVDDRGWHATYAANRDAGREPDLDYAYPPNLAANRALNAEWKAFIHRPELLAEVAAIRVPAIFIYGSEDIRPSWPPQQLANLIRGARFVMLEGAAHNLWLTHSGELEAELRRFLSQSPTA